MLDSIASLGMFNAVGKPTAVFFSTNYCLFFFSLFGCNHLQIHLLNGRYVIKVPTSTNMHSSPQPIIEKGKRNKRGGGGIVYRKN